MKENFDKSLKMILHHEGGYVNHPRDPGGETNLGVTKRVYEEWGGTKDMRDLTQEDVAPIYEKNYWGRAKCDHLPSGLDLAVFDWAVNSGCGRAVKALQKCVGAKQDGGLGPLTLKEVGKKDPKELIEMIAIERETFYRKLKTFKHFGKGWLRRNNETRSHALVNADD